MVRGLKTNKEVVKTFKETLQSVADILGKPPQDVMRDEYIKTSINNKLPRLNKVQLNSIGGYKVAKDLFFPKKSKKKDIKGKEKDEQKAILNAFNTYVKENKRIPTGTEFTRYLGRSFKKYYGSTEEVYYNAIKVRPSINNHVFNETFFTDSYTDEVNNKIKEYKRYVITTAVSGKKVCDVFLDCLKTYANENNALILILPCEDTFNRKSVYKWELDNKLKEFCVVHKDTYLNSNIYVNDIRVSAKQIEPLTGLPRFSQRNGSTIVASPKQFLEYVPTSNTSLPNALMTTGAITENNYNTDYYMSKRISKIAEHDHVIGAVVIEIQDDKVFHFRQLQLGNSNTVMDLNKEYRANGEINEVTGTVAVFGDTHCGKDCPDVTNKLKEITDHVNIKDILLHDLFNGESISHHISSYPTHRAKTYMEGKGSLEKECAYVAKYLENLGSWIDGDIVVVRSNHDEHLDRYLLEGRFVGDPVNMYFSLDLCKALMEGKNPLQYALEEKIGLSDDVSIKWLERDEDYRVYGTQCANHGDKGPNGARGSKRNLEKCYDKVTAAHLHSPCIFREVYITGVTSSLDHGYNIGPSSWVHSICLSYPNGARSLVSIVQDKKGEYSWKA
jgi:hypothetical protein